MLGVSGLQGLGDISKIILDSNSGYLPKIGCSLKYDTQSTLLPLAQEPIMGVDTEQLATTP